MDCWHFCSKNCTNKIRLINATLAVYGTRQFITVFTTSSHWALDWASFIRFTLLLLASDFLTKMSLPPPSVCATCPVLLNLLDVTTRTILGWAVQVRKFLIFLVIKPTRCTNFSNLFLKWNYMFRTVPLSIIRSFFFTVQATVIYVIQVCCPLASRIRISLRN